MLRSVFFFFFLISINYLFSQKHADCKNALKLADTLLSVETLLGPGDVTEINGFELGNKMYFTEEHNTMWIELISPYESEFTFIVSPKKPTEDFDFLLFESGIEGCESILSKKLKPVRSNLARNDAKNAGKTGLSKLSTENYVPAGVNPNMSKMLNVVAGKKLMLVIDINDEHSSGFDLQLNYKKIEEEILIEEVAESTSSFDFVDMTESPTSKDAISISFEVLVEGTENPIECTAEIIGVDWQDETLKFENKSAFTADIPKGEWFFINVKKEGYTFGTEKFKATDELVNDVQKIYISPIATGSHIVLKEIVFRENTTHLLPTSINALDQLISFMNEYPNATIEVQGHVNAPNMDNEGKVKKFSLKRAEQIKEYLVGAGIDGKRVKVAGLGNEFMIYPNPKNYEQEKVNRRVEIEILSF